MIDRNVWMMSDEYPIEVCFARKNETGHLIIIPLYRGDNMIAKICNGAAR